MAAWKTSSLAFSDHNVMRNGHGLLKNLPTRISKQHLVEHKMFGSKRGMTGKDIKIGKKFKKIGKGISSKPSSGDPLMKAKGISPSIAEFDKMMSSVVGKKSSGFSKKPSFSRKSFG